MLVGVCVPAQHNMRIQAMLLINGSMVSTLSITAAAKRVPPGSDQHVAQ